ncbi:CRISPR-associated protein Cas4 [Thermogladius calderae 1633]|uniref:CRISPR-associated exonuclease Cas4 n=2 Tax=Thermogladius calderae TaxID=1200300 RepID=I3TE32_THEC1|nr:CRISPR-associated protein Cas4 [Thermogladius calderae 1633]
MGDQVSRISELTDPRVVYVTDLVSCHHKFHLRKLYPELSLSFEPSAIMGNLIHAGIESIVLQHGFVPEYTLEKHVIVGGSVYVLKGRVDAYNIETREVLEIKSVKTFQGEPYDHHVHQLNMYLNLLNSPRGYLLYVSPDRIVEYVVEPFHVDIEEEVARLLMDEKHPMYPWECRYCPYRKICPYRRPEGEAEREATL